MLGRPAERDDDAKHDHAPEANSQVHAQFQTTSRVDPWGDAAQGDLPFFLSVPSIPIPTVPVDPLAAASPLENHADGDIPASQSPAPMRAITNDARQWLSNG